MKKAFSLIVAVIILTTSLIGCGTDKAKDKTGNSQNVSTKEDNIKTFQKGSELKLDDLDIKIKNIKFTEDVLPDNTKGFYTHYPADKGKVFLEIDTDVKNNNKQKILVEKIGGINVDYDNGYKYDGWLIPEDSQTGFSYANIKSIDPLEKLGVRWVVNLPEEVEKSNKPLKITLTIGNEQYICNFR